MVEVRLTVRNLVPLASPVSVLTDRLSPLALLTVSVSAPLTTESSLALRQLANWIV
mgnify:CR=1 FL=1